MKRLTQAPNIAIATVWADMLTDAGIQATVQRMYASSIAGELPPDQALPEVWVTDDAELERARTLLHALRHPVHRQWVCRHCHERVDGPFEQCWNCGAEMPAP
jgi:rubrerythrin